MISVCICCVVLSCLIFIIHTVERVCAERERRELIDRLSARSMAEYDRYHGSGNGMSEGWHPSAHERAIRRWHHKDDIKGDDGDGHS